jgi:high-affinity Fe2+/Pb2+ permease
MLVVMAVLVVNVAIVLAFVINTWFSSASGGSCLPAKRLDR